jgi:DNA-binding transcriptional LysR family regulator
MDLNQLTMLLAVVDYGGYAQAGKALNISHSAIHRQIRLLEGEIQQKALIRVGRHVKPTEAGDILAILARRIQKQISEARQQLVETGQLLTGHLSIGTGSSILVSFLPPILERYRRDFPGVEVSITTGTTADAVIEGVVNGQLDLGIVFNPADVPPKMRRARHEFLYKEEFIWAVGPGHPLAHRKCVALDEIAQYPMIMLPRTSHIRRACERLFENAGLKPRVALELENEQAIEKLVEVGLGLALRSRHRAPGSKIRCFMTRGPRIHCEVGIVYPPGDHLPKAVTEFARFCREASETLLVDRKSG